MDLTIGKLLNAKPALEKLLSLDLPAATAFRLARLTQGLNGELAAFETVRRKVILKHCPDGGDAPPATREAILAELDEALRETVSISFDPLPVEALGDAVMSASDAMALDFLIKE
jgi:hypothetical protein